MAIKTKGKQRYEIRNKLGEGGMGVVYLAFDREIKREVALKTIRDIQSAAQLDLFYKECELLKSLSHPNIVELFDIGVFEEEGGKKPYFVMPLLRGVTLQELIRTSSRRLTIARSVEIISQACRGLQAAHDAGLVHRDMKPSNIFVMEDDSVKIIDFGIARIVDVLSATGWKGTLAYMSPEQVQLKPVSSASDIFSLGIVAYETLSRRRPFEGQSERDVADAIVHSIPPPVSTLNLELNQMIGHVIHKAIAKQPMHRFGSAREFADALQKAMRNEMIDLFDPVRIQPRIQRATRAFESGDYQFASEILDELESEGHIDPGISALRGRVEQVVRQKKVQRLIDQARSRFEEEEYPLALQKIQEALEIDLDNAEALGLRRMIEEKRTVEMLEDWFRLARQHIENYSFDHAREAVENVLKEDPTNAQASRLLIEIQRKEQEYSKIRREKDDLFQVAQQSWQKGDVTGALSKLERVLELERQAPDRSTPGLGNAYMTLYNQVRSAQDLITNAYAEGCRHFAERDFAKARAVCDQFLAQYPNNAFFQALRFDVEEQERQERSAFIAETDRRVEAEPNLDRRVVILEEALNRYPGEAHFERALRLMREKRDFVKSIVVTANNYEEHGQFIEAIGQWEILKTVYREYPGLEFEVERLTKRRDQKLRVQAKARWVEQIDQHLEAGEYEKALETSQSAQTEFTGDAELLQMEKLAREGIDRSEEAQKLLDEARSEYEQKRFDKGIEILRRAYKLDERNPALRRLLADTLVEQARTVIDHDGKAAEDLVQQALELDPNHLQARGFRTIILDRRKHESIDQCRAQARQLQTAGDIRGAMRVVDQASARFPNEPQLAQLQTNLSRILSEGRSRDLDRLRHMAEEAEASPDLPTLSSLSERASDIARNYPDDKDVSALISKIRRRIRAVLPAEQKEAPVADHLAETQVLRRKRFQPIALMLSFFGRVAARIRQSARRPIATGGSPHTPSPQESTQAAQQVPQQEDTARTEVTLRSRAEMLIRTITTRPAYWIPALVIVLGLLVALPLVKIFNGSSTTRVVPAEPPTVSVSIQNVPPGAAVKIDGVLSGETTGQFKPGAHSIQVSLEGYRPYSETKTIRQDTTTWILPELQPLGATLRLSEAQPDALLDEAPLLEDELKDLSSGHHVLKLVKPAKAQIEFDSPLRAIPQVPDLKGVPQSLFAAVVSTFDNSIRILLNQNAPKYKLLKDADPAMDFTGSIKKDGSALVAENLQRGNYVLQLGEGESMRPVELELGAVPFVAIQISELATVTVTVNILTMNEYNTPLANVEIIQDGIFKGTTDQNGRKQVSVEPGRPYIFSVRKVAKLPEPKSFTPRKGGNNTVTFTIPTEKPRLATLRIPVIAGNNEGAEVLMDNEQIGEVPTGTSFFEKKDISVGKHSFTLKKDKYEDRTVPQINFTVDSEITLKQEDVRLRYLYGTLVVDITPVLGKSILDVQMGGQNDWQRISRTPAELKEGEYQYRASAGDHESKVGPFIINGDRHETKLTISLVPISLSSKMEGWEEQAKWQGAGKNWFVRKGSKGGEYAKYNLLRPTGTISFYWQKRIAKGIFSSRTIPLRWAINFVDERNCLYFEFDGNKLTSSEKTKGTIKKRDPISIPSKKDQTEFLIQVTIGPDSVVTVIADAQGAQPKTDSWKIPTHEFGTGKFAFYLPENEEIWIRDFSFQSKK